MTAEQAGVLSARGLQHQYVSQSGTTKVLDSIDLTLQPGRLSVLVGPNAVGKSTIIRILAGLELPTAGQIGRSPVGLARPSIGLQTQEIDETMLPWRSNLENVAFGLEATGVAAGRVTGMVHEFVEKYSLRIPLDKPPFASSGGERQMVAVARAAVVKPAVVLLDEPFSRIDPTIIKQWWIFLRQFVVEEGVAGLVVTHNVVEAAALADEVIVLGRTDRGASIRDRLMRPLTPNASDNPSGHSLQYVDKISHALDRSYA